MTLRNAISYHLIAGQYSPKKYSGVPPALSFPRAFCVREASVRVARFVEDRRTSEKVRMGIFRRDGEAHGNAAPCLARAGDSGTTEHSRSLRAMGSPVRMRLRTCTCALEHGKKPDWRKNLRRARFAVEWSVAAACA